MPTTSDRPDQPTWRRRLIRMAQRLGLQVSEAGAGTVVVSRRHTFRVAQLSRDALLLIQRNDAEEPVQAAPFGRDSWFVSTNGALGKSAVARENAVLKRVGTAHLGWLLEHYRVDCVLDVGANRGQFAKNIRSAGFRGHIASFEPVPAFAAEVEAASANDDNWSVHQMALGRTDGSLPIRVQETFSSFLPSSEYGMKRFDRLRRLGEQGEVVEVPLRRLDSVLDEVLAPLRRRGVTSPRIFLKLDTQGFDLEAFGGLGKRAPDVVGLQSEMALLTIYESMPRMAEALGVYENAGFEITGLFPVTRERDGRVIEYDCVMVRASAAGGSGAPS